MKKLLVFFMIVSLLFVIGCSQKPEDVAHADVGDDVDAPADGEAHDSAADGTDEHTEELDGEEADAHDDEADGDDSEAVEKVAVNKDASSFEFEGYAPGKSHVGTFEEMDGFLHVEDGAIVGMEGTIQANSVKTDSSKLDEHLMNDDFFDVENYPVIEFKSMTVENGEMKGTLNFHGVEEELSFPVTVTEEGVSADFLLDTTPFNFKYTGVDKDVRITFDIKK